ncbi:MBLC1 protein, partial [Odontophorus gujanensis]|nr:MBLC1 protein [Odontophorus gujanensis]
SVAMFRTAPLGSQHIPGSPYNVTILQEGYSRPRSDRTFEADCTITLVRGGPVTALVDTGGPWGRQRLLDALDAVAVSPRDVTHVLCTHGHVDHVGNLNLFPS